jgi:hypothetical protein
MAGGMKRRVEECVREEEGSRGKKGGEGEGKGR